MPLKLPFGGLHADVNGRFIFSATSFEPGLEGFNGNWAKEDDVWVEVGLGDANSAVNVHVNNADLAGVDDRADCRKRRSVKVAMYFTCLEELAVFDVLLHLVAGCEVVGDAMLLSWSWCASGVGHGEGKTFRMLFHHLFLDGALPDARRADKDKWSVLGRHLCQRPLFVKKGVSGFGFITRQPQ